MDKKHILIVDDEPKVTYFLGKALERSEHPYSVSRAESGEEALEMIERSRVDLLVTDLKMPGMSGLELIRRVQYLSPETRTILITAHGSSKVEEEARHLNTSNYIPKPFGIDDFTEAVKEALREIRGNQTGFTMLSDDTFDAIAQELNGLKAQIGANCIYMADMQGQCLTRVGDIEGLETSTLLGLLAGGFATTSELNRQYGEGEAASLTFYKGSRYEIYSANVGEDFFLALIFTRVDQKGRIGLVWLYTQRTILKLLAILSNAEPQSLPFMEEGFDDNVRNELDTLFEQQNEDIAPPEEIFRVIDAKKEAASRMKKEAEKKTSREAEERDLINYEKAIEKGVLPEDFEL